MRRYLETKEPVSSVTEAQQNLATWTSYVTDAHIVDAC